MSQTEKNVHALHLHQLQPHHTTHTFLSAARKLCFSRVLNWTDPNRMKCARRAGTDQMRTTNLFNYTLYLHNYYVNDGKSLPFLYISLSSHSFFPSFHSYLSLCDLFARIFEFHLLRCTHLLLFRLRKVMVLMTTRTPSDRFFLQIFTENRH